MPAASDDSTKLAEQVAAGLRVFRGQYCGVCHVLDTAGTAGTFGPTHNGMGATAEERIKQAAFTGQAATAGEYILESLVDPNIYIAPGFERTRFPMPAYTHLSEEELNALVQMLLKEK
ncbi:MAG: c-type cytochrome [Gemmatimonadota bacterium]